jgi:hypothetical protein
MERPAGARESEREGWREGGRDTTLKGLSKKKILFPPVPKVPRQCPLALMIHVCLSEGKSVGSERVKF